MITLCAVFMNTGIVPQAEACSSTFHGSEYSAPVPRAAAGKTVCSFEDSDRCQFPDQQSHGSTNIFAAISDSSAGLRAADNFTAQETGVITQTCWWGVYVNFGAGSDCVPDATDSFSITYYTDDGGIPGAVHAGPFVTGFPERIPTGRFVSGFTEYSFTADHPSVAVEADACYWIEIVNDTAGECLWLWNATGFGDEVSVQDFSGSGYEESDLKDYDLAWCIDAALLPGGCTASCELECAKDATPESEPDCRIDYVDEFNGGCDSPEPAWSPIALGDNVCGRSGNFVTTNVPCSEDEDCVFGDCGNNMPGLCDLPQRGQDTDWYELDLSGRETDTFVSIALQSTFRATVGVIDLMGTCQDWKIIDGGSFDVESCSTEELDICLPPSLYSIRVSTLTATALAPCPSTYELTVDDAGECPEFQAVCDIEDTLRCQLPNQLGNGSGVVGAFSDANAFVSIADNFQSLSGGSINQICWWGFYADASDKNADCGPGGVPDNFTITYYNDDAGGVVPGSLKAGPFVIGAADEKSATGLFVPGPDDGYFEYGFTTAHPPVDTLPGECLWVSITNDTNGGGECLWAWSSAPPGDQRSASDEGAGFDEDLVGDFDLSWCVTPFVTLTGCEVTGACCDDDLGTCVDNIPILECEGRFQANTSCLNMDPPCGGGACCSPQTGACTDTLELDCLGQFHPDVFCDDVICNIADTCGWNNGLTQLGPSVGSQFAPQEFYTQTADNFILKGSPGHCVLDQISWSVQHYDHQGTCPDGTRCTIGDVLACGGEPGTCTAGAYANDPSDYEAIDVVIYRDTFVAGEVQRFGVEEVRDIPEGVEVGEPAHCVDNAECRKGEECVDNNGDGTTECTLVSEIVVDLDESIVDLDVELVIAHTWQGDLVVRLEKVDGPSVQLLRRPGNNQIHPGTYGPDGYREDNFGNPNVIGSVLRIDDDDDGHINDYAGPAPGIENYLGPVVSGGGGDPGAVLQSFDGLSKSGTYRLYVSDDYGGGDVGQLIEWRLRFVDIPPVASQPSGIPEHVAAAVGCDRALDCLEAGCAGADCVEGTCMVNDQACEQPVPTGEFVPFPEAVCRLEPGEWTWSPLRRNGDTIENFFDMTADLSNCAPLLLKNTGYYLALSPALPFRTGPFYRTGWLRSVNQDGVAAKHTTEGLPWEAQSGLTDVRFSLSGSAAKSSECPNGTIGECADLNDDQVRDDVCVWWSCTAGTCEPVEVLYGDFGGQFGDCQPDGVADGNDHFSALNCFANSDITGQAPSYPCEDTGGAVDNAAYNTDVASKSVPCNPDGVCDGADALAALDAFMGSGACVCGTPSPEFDVQTTAHATLDIRTSQGRLAPGRTLEVEVYSTAPLADLRAYQLHMAAHATTHGTVDIVDIAVSAPKYRSRPTAQRGRGNHHDDVFAGQAVWKAYNAITGQVVAGVYTPGVPVKAGYMATFTLLLSPDAQGQVIVDLLTNSDDPNARTTLFSSSPYNLIHIAPVKPLVIEIGLN